MPFGFYIIMAAQFFSALADNALLIVTIALLAEQGQPASLLLVDDSAVARAKLGKLFESADNAASIPCYLDEGRDLVAVIRATRTTASWN